MKTTIHFLQYGMTACMKAGEPATWPENEKWSGDWGDVTCPECITGLNNMRAPTFEIATDGSSITCLRCHRTSYSREDIELHYCGRCRAFHDDIWPPARHWWVTHPDPEPPAIRKLPLPKPE